MSMPTIILGIDQSLNGTGFCVLVNGRPELVETLSLKAKQGYGRLTAIRQRLWQLIGTFKPTLVCMEGLSYNSPSPVVIGQLAEVSGVVKQLLNECGYCFGRDSLTRNQNTVLVYSPGTMKKFCLGRGDAGRDSDEEYLRLVFDTFAIQFADTNQADAFMHAWMGEQVAKILSGNVRVSSYTELQLEALMTSKVKTMKGLTMRSALKLPDSEKIKLIGYY